MVHLRTLTDLSLLFSNVIPSNFWFDQTKPKLFKLTGRSFEISCPSGQSGGWATYWPHSLGYFRSTQPNFLKNVFLNSKKSRFIDYTICHYSAKNFRHRRFGCLIENDETLAHSITCRVMIMLPLLTVSRQPCYDRHCCCLCSVSQPCYDKHLLCLVSQPCYDKHRSCLCSVSQPCCDKHRTHYQ